MARRGENIRKTFYITEEDIPLYSDDINSQIVVLKAKNLNLEQAYPHAIFSTYPEHSIFEGLLEKLSEHGFRYTVSGSTWKVTAQVIEAYENRTMDKVAAESSNQALITPTEICDI